MDRREHLRTLLLAGLAGSTILSSCNPDGSTGGDGSVADPNANSEGYGRTPAEKKHDEELMSETFFTESEMATLGVLTAMIIPADERSGSAMEAGVPDFMEFIVKEIPDYQLPLRGGIAWLDTQSRAANGMVFAEATEEQRTQLLDQIAYPPEDSAEETFGHHFFDLMRFLTMTGFYTSQVGIQEDLQYQGNYANVWDGVPDEVLAKYEVAYDPEWTAKCLDVSTRNEVAKWDEDGNLI